MTELKTLLVFVLLQFGCVVLAQPQAPTCDAQAPNPSAACPLGMTCNNNGMCVAPPSSCAAILCSENTRCEDGECKPIECNTKPGEKRCPFNLECKGGKCQPPVTSCAAVTCLVNTECVDGKCIPIKCDKEKPCISGWSCQNGRCKALCAGKVCPEHTICEEGECKPVACNTEPGEEKCSFGLECRDGKCQPHDTSCAAVTCLYNTECVDGKCIGIKCDKEKPCSPGWSCINGRCKAVCAIIRCASGYVCIDNEGGCVPKPCEKPCAPGWTCKLGKCVPKCHVLLCRKAAISKCVDGQCVPVWTRRCRRGQPCPDGYKCKNRKCKPKNAKVAACSPGTRWYGGRCFPVARRGCRKFQKPCMKGWVCKYGKCRPTCGVIRCETGYQCTNGRCVTIRCRTKPCPLDLTCKKGICRPRTTSCSAVLCPYNTRCEKGNCIPTECGPEKPCQPDWYCSGGKCEPTCNLIDCRDGAICLRGICYATQCKNEQCKPGYICVKQSCQKIPDCNVHPCSGGFYCDKKNGKCVRLPQGCPKLEPGLSGICQYQCDPAQQPNEKCGEEQICCPAACGGGLCYNRPRDYCPKPKPADLDDGAVGACQWQCDPDVLTNNKNCKPGQHCCRNACGGGICYDVPTRG